MPCETVTVGGDGDDDDQSGGPSVRLIAGIAALGLGIVVADGEGLFNDED